MSSSLRKEYGSRWKQRATNARVKHIDDYSTIIVIMGNAHSMRLSHCQNVNQPQTLLHHRSLGGGSVQVPRARVAFSSVMALCFPSQSSSFMIFDAFTARVPHDCVVHGLHNVLGQPSSQSRYSQFDQTQPLFPLHHANSR